MKIVDKVFDSVLLMEPTIYGDDRGFFYESFNQDNFNKIIGSSCAFVQDNHSYSTKGTLRGLHYQNPKPQGKLVRVIRGEVYDVVVDLRQSSEFYGFWHAFELNDLNKYQLWVPEGFAHGFQVVSNTAHFLYKTTQYWFPEYDKSIFWNDPNLAIDWPIKQPLLSNKDSEAPSFFDSKHFS